MELDNFQTSFLAKLERIEAKLDLVMNGPESALMNIAELERVLGLTAGTCKSTRYRLLHKYGIKARSHGRYVRTEVTNAIMRARELDRIAGDKAAELQTEARSHARTTPHE